MRESPLVALAEKLIGKGYQLKIFDPVVETARLMGANKNFIEREIPHLEALLQPDVRSTLDGSEKIVIGHVESQYVDDILSHRPSLPIIDLQGVARIEQAGLQDYRGICW